MQEQKSLEDMTVEELKMVRGDQYQIRENAQAIIQQSNVNIKAINDRLDALLSEPDEDSPVS